MKRLFSLMLVFVCVIMGKAQTKEYVITAYGARPDGITNNVQAIQKAIDEAYNAGGGRVVIPRGRFVTGVIHLKSNVELFVHEEAVLLASFNRADYGPSLNASALITADHQSNIAITGKGLIDGQCDLLINDIYTKLRLGELYDDEWKAFNPWFQRRPSEKNRPRIIEFKNCNGITVKNIHIQNSAAWVQDYKACSNITIDSIHVFSNTFWNNDGIDLVDCKNARVTNCIINAADDGICLKSEDRNDHCENIYVANCRIRSSASAVKLGTASLGGFQKIKIRNIDVYDTYRSAIAIETVDGGFVKDIDVKGVRAVNTGNAIFIRLGHRNNDNVYSILRNVSIEDVKVIVPATKPDKGYPMEGPGLKYPKNYKIDTSTKYNSVSPWNNSGIDSSAIPYPHNVFPAGICGIPGHPVENVTLKNIEVVYEGGGDSTVNYMSLNAVNTITEAAGDYPEFSMFGELPSWAMYVRHVEGLTMQQIKFINKKADYRTGILINQSTNIHLKAVTIEGPVKNPVIYAHETKALVVDTLKSPVKNEKAIIIK
ncbi:MAG: glycoside hydrolase family 28 protein [Bacteroidota bacterium]|nr:glycoside hydrolase family 28 protein [Bacteroidota bacterium]